MILRILLKIGIHTVTRTISLRWFSVPISFYLEKGEVWQCQIRRLERMYESVDLKPQYAFQSLREIIETKQIKWKCSSTQDRSSCLLKRGIYFLCLLLILITLINNWRGLGACHYSSNHYLWISLGLCNRQFKIALKFSTQLSGSINEEVS